jgi:hypothetical protein
VNKNTSGMVLLIIISLVGLYKNIDLAWLSAIVTAAITFIVEEIRGFPYQYGKVPATATWIAFSLALLSWVSIATGLISLLLGKGI